jgi:hypothetical protein
VKIEQQDRRVEWGVAGKALRNLVSLIARAAALERLGRSVGTDRIEGPEAAEPDSNAPQQPSKRRSSIPRSDDDA